MRRHLLVTLVLLSALLVAACAPGGQQAPAAEAPASAPQEAAPAPEKEAPAPEEAPEEEAPPAEMAAVPPAAVMEGAIVAAPPPASPEAQQVACTNTYEGQTLKIYQQAGLTGPLASILGAGFVNATKDAIAEINAAGGVCGVQLEQRLEDTQYNPEQEVAVYERFRAEDPKPIFIYTYGSGATIALKDRVVEDQIVNIASGLNAQAFYDPPNGWTVGVAPIYSDQFAGFVQWVNARWDEIKPEGAGDEIVVGVIGWANAYGAGATTPEALAYIEATFDNVTVLPLEQQPIDPTADVTGQLQNLLVNGANVIYIQSLSFGPVQVISTLHALGMWDQVVVGTNNWGMNRDVLNLLGENAELAVGLYGVFPWYWWNDLDHPGIQQARAAFERGGYPESDMAVSYLTSYTGIYGVADVLVRAMNQVGFEGLTGQVFFDTMKEMGVVSNLGVYELNAQGSDRAPRKSQIRQAQKMDDGRVDFVTVQDWFWLPDTRPQVGQ